MPVALLALLTLVLGGTLAFVALAPAVTPAGSAPTDRVAAALAAAVARGQEAILASADETPVLRILVDPSPAPAAVARARTVLDDLAASLGDPDGAVVLVDASGRTRLSRTGSSAQVPLPAGPRDLERVLALRDGAFVAGTGDAGRTVLFAVRVADASGRSVGALVAAVPATALVAGAGGPVDGAIHLGSAAGNAWTAVSSSAAGGLVPSAALLGLAGLSLLALPLAVWAARRPRPPASVAMAPLPAGGLPPTPATPVRHAPRPPAYQTSSAMAATPWVATAPDPGVAPAMGTATPTGVATASSGSVPITQAAPDTGGKRRGRFGRGRAEPETPVQPVLDIDAQTAPVQVALAGGTDSLTGLGDMDAWGEELERQMVGWQRNRVPFALLLLDVDGLDITNTRSGRAAGDEQLKALGRQVKAMLRFSDRAFRIGGDEIAVVLPHTDAAGAVQLGQRLLARARAGEGGEPATAFCGGATAFPGSATDAAGLLAAATAAVAWAKAHGRGSVLAYDPATHAVETDAERAAQASAVAQVIEERCLRPVFQPIVDMATGEVLGYEGLTRPGPGAPFTNPGALFEAAEACGRTVELDAACFEAIVAGARAIPADRVVSINLSPRTMEAADFSVAGVLEVLGANGIDPGRVIMELTERETVLDLDRLRDNLAELQRAGVRVAADDVGAGNAGLRLLSQFRFDIVKVDLSLVQEGANNDASRAVLRSLRDLATRWGAFVIAEGIETPMQLRVVRELGLTAGQGYLIGRPGTIVDLPPVDLVGLEQGQLMLQNAPAPGTALAQGGLA